MKITKWYDASTVLWEGEVGSLSEAVIKALKANANLTNADLTNANLTNADLTNVDLTNANLTNADLTNANLTNADLMDANLRDADLTNADLRDADLTNADLTNADLTNANLTNVDLTNANLTNVDLTNADLTNADLTPIRDDIWAVLSAAPAEVSALLEMLESGRIDGSCYDGECACLVGTIANASECDYQHLPILKPNAARPAEKFFMAISVGDTPETNQASALAAQWVGEWLTRMQSVFGGAK